MSIKNKTIFWIIMILLFMIPTVHYFIAEKYSPWMFELNLWSIWRGLMTIFIIFFILWHVVILLAKLEVGETQVNIYIPMPKISVTWTRSKSGDETLTFNMDGKRSELDIPAEPNEVVDEVVDAATIVKTEKIDI